MPTSISPEVIGFIGGIFTTFSSLPQIVKILRTRSMNDVSLVSLCMLAIGIAIWLGYGIMMHAASVIIWNAISLSMSLTQIALKITTAKVTKRQPLPTHATSTVLVLAN